MKDIAFIFSIPALARLSRYVKDTHTHLLASCTGRMHERSSDKHLESLATLRHKGSQLNASQGLAKQQLFLCYTPLNCASRACRVSCFTDSRRRRCASRTRSLSRLTDCDIRRAFPALQIEKLFLCASISSSTGKRYGSTFPAPRRNRNVSNRRYLDGDELERPVTHHRPVA